MSFFEKCANSFENMNKDHREACTSLWNRVSLSVQNQKLNNSMIFEEEKRNDIIQGLMKRPEMLVHVADVAISEGLSMRNFIEVGTAQGMQSIIFSHVFSDSRVFTCDIKDERDSLFGEYKNLEFFLGDSLKMSNALRDKLDHTVDFCWIDGSHDHYAVVEDFISILPRTHKNTIWAFDDYDKRFGCFHDLNLLSRHLDEKMVLEFGLTASGQPNRVLLAKGTDL